MKRYYFDIQVDDGRVSLDDEGALHLDAVDAEKEAIRTLFDIASERTANTHASVSVSVNVNDDDGSVFSAHLKLSRTRLS